jgi:hypothetical protein
MRKVSYDDTINSIAAIYIACNVSLYSKKSGYDFVFDSSGTSYTLVIPVIKIKTIF